MNILLVSYWGETAPCGVRVHYMALAQELRELGHCVTIVTPNTLGGLRRRMLGGLQRLLALPGPGAEHVARELWYYAMIYAAVPREVHFDLVNAHDVGSGAAVHRALGGRVPVVVTGHASEHPAEEIIRRNELQGAAARFIRRWYAWLLPHTQYFIGVSDNLLSTFRAFLPSALLTRRIYGGSSFAQPPTTEAPAEVLFPDRHLVINVGYLDTNKNQRYLIEVARELRPLRPDFMVGLVGKGAEEDALRAQIAEYGLENHVVLLGYHSSVVPLLRQASLYVHAAHRESLGLALVEAIMAGTPVLAPATGGIPEVLGATPEALFAPGLPPAQLAQQVHQLLADCPARTALHARQHAYATEHFSLRRIAQHTLQFYHDTLHHFRSAAPTHQAAPAVLSSTTPVASSLS
ncbi:glycosyltransferase family 4 protein [Hymenobacter chitinivorans]|uniref:Glycosyltransferase involved in cell wall biosynthesis n=1 Tax=Hymenobacter chitinivorans DSM 11115 TaxID=1121954 RepID=A0A2M9BPA9_9BACT|nr:glycosyltransferase family 4 protein [Hymenobacter chitinivorans]PJJ59786.1 glycosyltransferase involved in cell wall biosynthesis [Hymenobacter chitinivorans DSM 11115]